MDLVYLMLNDKGQTEPVQLVNASGVPQPLDANDPLVARLNTGPGSGRPVRLPKEHNEFVEAMEFTEYHYFVDENNKVIPIPPGSIVQGEFQDEEEEDDNNMDQGLQENDQLRNDLAQVSSEIAQVAGEMELPAAKCEDHLEEEIVPCSGEEQELTGQSELAETKLAEGHPVASYGDFGLQEHSGAATMDETGELHLENASETIFTQDEIELEEEVVSLQISEPELVAVKPSIKYSKRAAILTGHHDLSSGIGKSTDASFVGELQVKSPLKKLKKKLVPVGGTTESQASAVEKIPLQSGKKGLHHPVESHATPSALEPSVTDTGRPKRSVPRRSALEMLHGEGKARKPHASSGSDSEVDGGSATQHLGKRCQSKGAEKKALTAEKLAKTPLLSNTECKNEAQLSLTPQDLSVVNADKKCDETLEINSVSNMAFTNVQSPVISVKRGKGRPRKLVPDSPRVVCSASPEITSALQKDLVSMGSASSTESRDDSGHQVTLAAEKESSKAEAVVISEIDVASKGLELSDSQVLMTSLSSNDSTEPAFIDVLEPGGMEIKAEAEQTHVVASDTVDKVGTSAGPRQKPLKRGRGRRKSMGEKKASGFENPKNAEEMARLCAEREATIVKDMTQMETQTSVDTTSEHLPWSPQPLVEISNVDGELRSVQVAEDDGQVTRIVAEDLSEKEGHLATTFECNSSIRELEEESFSGNLLKEDRESIRDICDSDGTAGRHAVCKEVEDSLQLDNGSKTVEPMIQEEQEEHLVVDEAIAMESDVAEERLVESDVHSANGELENTVTFQDACQLAKTEESTVEAEMYVANWEDSSYLVESQPENQIDTRVEMPEKLHGNETLEFENEQACVGIDMNQGTIHANAEDVLGSVEKCHAPVEEEDEEEERQATMEEDANLDRQVPDEEDIQDFDHESTGEPEAVANLSSDVELVGEGEERNVDRMEVNSQLTKSLLKHLQGAAEHGKKVELEPAFKKFEESVLGLDSKAALLIVADLEHVASNIRYRLTDRETSEGYTINQLPLPPEERVRKLVVAELMKLRALDQELDERHSQLMVARGQLNRCESDVKQREQRLERSRLLLDLEKETLQEERRKLLKQKESIQKQRKLYAKLRENKKRKAETETELSTSSKKVRIGGLVAVKERRPLFEEMTAIKETKTLTDSLQALDMGSSSENQSVTLQKQISPGTDECESKDSVNIDIQRLPDMPVEKSCVKADMESEEKSCVQKSDIPLTPSGVLTVVKGKKELLRRFEADELNSPGDEQKSNKSLSPKLTEDESKPSKSSSHMPTTDEQKPRKSSSHKSTADEQKPRKSSAHKSTVDEQKPRKSSSHKSTADEQKPRKSSAHKPTVDEQKPRKSSSHKPMKLEMPSSTTSKSLVKKSGQPSNKHTQNPTLSSPTPFDCVLNQSESLKSKKNSSLISSSFTGTNPKSSSGKSPSRGDGELRKDLPSSQHAKKQHIDGIDVPDSSESSSKLGRKDDVKRLSAQSDSVSKKKDNKQCKRISTI